MNKRILENPLLEYHNPGSDFVKSLDHEEGTDYSAASKIRSFREECLKESHLVVFTIEVSEYNHRNSVLNDCISDGHECNRKRNNQPTAFASSNKLMINDFKFPQFAKGPSGLICSERGRS
jgi:hypothetical protein